MSTFQNGGEKNLSKAGESIASKRMALATVSEDLQEGQIQQQDLRIWSPVYENMRSSLSLGHSTGFVVLWAHVYTF